jgi:hypothetical protein
VTVAAETESTSGRIQNVWIQKGGALVEEVRFCRKSVAVARLLLLTRLSSTRLLAGSHPRDLREVHKEWQEERVALILPSRSLAQDYVGAGCYFS